MFVFSEEVDSHIKVMIENFDAEQYVYLLEHKQMMLVYDNLTDEMQILKALVHVDYVHDDIHLNVVVHVLYC
jgi:hypothetical protein